MAGSSSPSDFLLHRCPSCCVPTPRAGGAPSSGMEERTRAPAPKDSKACGPAGLGTRTWFRRVRPHMALHSVCSWASRKHTAPPPLARARSCRPATRAPEPRAQRRRRPCPPRAATATEGTPGAWTRRPSHGDRGAVSVTGRRVLPARRWRRQRGSPSRGARHSGSAAHSGRRLPRSLPAPLTGSCVR